MAHTSNDLHDDIRYCARCGISFVWSREEQAQTTGGEQTKPLLCPGCRRLLPAAGRERGLVKWYNVRKQYGFIVRKEQPELYVHRSQVEEPTPLKPLELVEFGVEQSEKGLQAVGVRRVEGERGMING